MQPSTIQESSSERPARQTDVAIIGAGPMGIELAILFKRAGIDYLHFESRQIGDTILQWPPNTRFFSSPERVALAGVPLHTYHQQSVTGETYLAYLRELVESFELAIQTFEPVVELDKTSAGHFALTTQSLGGQRHYLARHVVMAVGNMNLPRRMGIVGEDLPHVYHRLQDPHLFFKKKLLIIGGKNSALEAALRCWRGGAQVSISYRGREFETSIVKPHLAREVNLLIKKKLINFFPETIPEKIQPGWATLGYTQVPHRTTRLPTDFVLFCIGYDSDTTLYEHIGVKLNGKAMRPTHDRETMETNIEGLYVCGTTAGGRQAKHELFISTCHEHVRKVMRAITGLEPSPVGAIKSRRYSVEFEEVQED